MIAALLFFNHSSCFAAVSQYEKYMQDGAQCVVRKDTQNAVEFFSKAIKEKPNDTKAYLKRAYQYCLLKKYDQAKADYDRAISLDPKNAKTYRERGCLLGATHKYQDAIKDFSKSIELNPIVSTPYMDRARAYQALGKPEMARKDIDMALKFYSANQKVGVKNNSIYFTYGSNSGANPTQKKLAGMGKGLVLALRGNLSGVTGDLDEALLDMNQSAGILQGRPERSSVRKSFNQKGKVEKLINTYSQLIYMNPRDLDSFYNRGIVYISLKQWDAAASNFTRVVELAKWDGKAAVQASIWRYVALRKQKRKTEAERVLSEATANCKEKGWPHPLLMYLSRLKSKDEILKSAHGAEQETQSHCLIGLMEGLAENKSESIKHFEWIEKYGDISLDEFVIALNELPG